MKNLRKTRVCIVIAAMMAILFLIIALGTKELFNNTTSPIPTTFQNILLNPAGLPNVIVTDLGAKIFYIISFLAPVAFLPLLAPEPLIMALPWIGLSFVSPYFLYSSVFYQYTAFVIPFVIIALLKGIEHLNLQQTRKIIPMLLIATIISLIYVPLSPGSPWSYQLPVPNDQTRMRNEVLALVPSNASILTENDLFPHVSGRPNAYMYIPQGSANMSVDCILVDLTSEWYKWEPVISGGKITPKGYLDETLEKGDYGVLASAQGAVLLEKGYTGEPVLFEPYVSKYDYKSLVLDSGSIVEDPSSTSKSVLFHGENETWGTFWHGPYVNFPFGLFKVTYVIKVDANFSRINWKTDELLTVDVAVSKDHIPLVNRTLYGENVPFNGQWFGVSLYFWLKKPVEQVEFRGFVNGNSNVYLDYVMVEQISPQPVSELTFNYNEKLAMDYNEKLTVDADYTEKLIMDQGTVSEGVMTHTKGAGTFWYGPYTFLPKGNYTAKFWLKLDGLYHGPIMDIVVSTNAGTTVLGSSAVNSYDFKEINTWQTFKVDFELPENTSKIEFAGMRVRDLAPVSFLMVEVYPDTGG